MLSSACSGSANIPAATSSTEVDDTAGSLADERLAARSRSRSRGRASGTGEKQLSTAGSQLRALIENSGGVAGPAKQYVEARRSPRLSCAPSPLPIPEPSCASNSSADSTFVLRSSLEEMYAIDSWNLRVAPSAEARAVATIRIGQSIEIVQSRSTAEWLKASVVTTDGKQIHGFVQRFLNETQTGKRIEVFVRPEEVEFNDGSRTFALDGGLSANDKARTLLQELKKLRRSYEEVPGDQRTTVGRSIEDIMNKLEFLGLSTDEILDREDPVSLMICFRGKSFAHLDFANPKAETCWLSCLFQSLWHSVVFHTVFDLYLAPTKFVPEPAEKYLTALQRTWAKYKAEAAADIDMRTDDDTETAATLRLIPAQDLVDAFGEGYGDMSEALASIQGEMSDSKNPVVKKISDLIVLIPLAAFGDTWPTPTMAWQQAEEWKATDVPLIAVDLSLPQLMQSACQNLAYLWVPKCNVVSGRSSDLGTGHRIVALVCYMWGFQHYVTFCRRQSDHTRCLFFNDLPGLTRGAPADLEWAQVPEVCYRYSLSPRMVLYESVGAAENIVLDLKAKQPSVGNEGNEEDRSQNSQSAPDSTSTAELVALQPGLLQKMDSQTANDLTNDLSELGETHGIEARLKIEQDGIELSGCAKAKCSAKVLLVEMLQFYFPGQNSSQHEQHEAPCRLQ